MNFFKSAGLTALTVATVAFGGCGKKSNGGDGGNPGPKDPVVTTMTEFDRVFIDGKTPNDGSVASVSLYNGNQETVFNQRGGGKYKVTIESGSNMISEADKITVTGETSKVDATPDDVVKIENTETGEVTRVKPKAKAVLEIGTVDGSNAVAFRNNSNAKATTMQTAPFTPR